MQSFKDLAIELALQAGEIMLNNFSLEMGKEWKEDNTPLTVSDSAINRLVIETISKRYPSHSILGEEESSLSASEYVWVCDPIDGTLPFSHGIPIFTFALALVQNGQPILGVIYDPIMKRMCFAEKGKGVFLNDVKIHVSSQSELKNSVVDIESWSDFPWNLNPLKEIIINKGCMAVSFVSMIYCGMLLASGNFSGVMYGGKKAWDGAAVKVIVEEAGGICTDMEGNDQRYDKEINGLIASNGHIHDQLIELVKLHTTKKI